MPAYVPVMYNVTGGGDSWGFENCPLLTRLGVFCHDNTALSGTASTLRHCFLSAVSADLEDNSPLTFFTWHFCHTKRQLQEVSRTAPQVQEKHQQMVMKFLGTNARLVRGLERAGTTSYFVRQSFSYQADMELSYSAPAPLGAVPCL